MMMHTKEQIEQFVAKNPVSTVGKDYPQVDLIMHKEAEAKKKAKAKAKDKTSIEYLPYFDEKYLICPTLFLRSALFGIVQRGKRKYIRNELIASWSNTEIRYLGEKLNQYDFDIWMSVLELVKDHPLETRVDFSARSFLKKLGKSINDQNKKRLFDSLNRMVGCALNVKVDGYFYVGSLIADFYHDKETGHYVIFINKKISTLFSEYTIGERAVRQSLAHDLTKWLLGYVESQKATERSPHRISLEALHELCGSEEGNMRKFRMNIKLGMEQLLISKSITKWCLTKNGALEFIKPRQRRDLSGAKASNYVVQKRDLSGAKA